MDLTDDELKCDACNYVRNFREGEKQMIKKACLLLILNIVFLISGCTYTAEVVERDETTDMLGIDLSNHNTVGIPSLAQELEVKDEPFKLICEYDTGTYPLEDWHVTDSKVITMTVKTKDLPEGYEVYIDHVHADISLKSTQQGLNGITQDSMDDTFHGTSQNGFYISNTDEYYNIFAIEGYTNQFYEIWGHSIGQYGAVSSSYSRMTERNIVVKGKTYAEKLTVIYDLSIKKPDSDKLYTKSVLSEILIPVSEKINIETRDFWTDEPITEEAMTDELITEEQSESQQSE